MPYKSFTLDELARAAALSVDQLEHLVAAKLLTPAAQTDDGTPVFDEADLAQAKSVKSLLELGYALPDVQKIVRKVGMPPVVRKRERRTEKLLTVGELARHAGLNPRTIKYWEEQEIIAPEAYTEGGFRLYPNTYILFCQLIRDLQLFGYSLKEIKEVADLFRTFDALSRNPDNVPPSQAVASFSDMLARIEELRGRMRTLRDGIQRWEGFTDRYAKQISKLKRQAERSARDADPSPAPPTMNDEPLEEPS
ncbi:MAG: MerR family transcriptional regulator [Myxococcota bacterium]